MASLHSPARLSASQLTHSYPGTGPLFEGLTFTLSAGEVVGVVGPSGSGKSTLLNLLAGWESPESGSITREGIHSIGWVFQNPHGTARRTALDHVVLPLLAQGASRQDAELHAHEILMKFDLGALGEREFRHLSGGEGQRLMLARATARAPDLLLVDEPTAQLDPHTATTVNAVLSRIAQDNTLVVIATHDPQTRAACSRVIDLGDVDRSSHVSTADPRPSREQPPLQGSLMRARSTVSEAVRNLLSGTTRALLWAAALVVLLGLLAVADTRAVVGLLVEAHDYRAAGASVQVLDAPGSVDARRCEALATIDGITASGALRSRNQPVQLLSLPSSTVPVFEATPGLAAVLGMTAPEPRGVWLPSMLGDTIDASVGGSVPTATGLVDVAGQFASPADGRLPTLEYALVTPVPAAGVFDACWAEVWPTSEQMNAQLSFALVPGADRTQVRQGQLNTRPGSSYAASESFDARLTGWATGAAALTGLALGFVSVRSRRLELASALHAGVGRSALTGQIVLETAAWAAAGALVTLPILWWAAQAGSPDPAPAVWMIGARTVLAGALATLPGAVLAVWTTRESLLFRYFKDR